MLDPGHLVDSYTFGDIARLWGRERLTHEVLIGRELAIGVFDEGLRLRSVNPKHVKASEAFRFRPYVGLDPLNTGRPVMLRDDALTHLDAVASGVADVSFEILRYEFVTKHDFRSWLIHTGRSLPAFWYGPEERAIDDSSGQS